MQIDLIPVRVQGRRMYDLSIKGRAIKGSRHFTKAEAEQERTKMMRSDVWRNAKQFLE